MEIALASKRKLGFVTGSVKKEKSNAVKAEAWETCNSMIISWIFGSVSESIKKSILFVSNAHQIWRQFEGLLSQMVQGSTNSTRNHIKRSNKEKRSVTTTLS